LPIGISGNILLKNVMDDDYFSHAPMGVLVKLNNIVQYYTTSNN